MAKIIRSNEDLNKDIGIDDNATSTAITIYRCYLNYKGLIVI